MWPVLQFFQYAGPSFSAFLREYWQRSEKINEEVLVWEEIVCPSQHVGQATKALKPTINFQQFLPLSLTHSHCLLTFCTTLDCTNNYNWSRIPLWPFQFVSFVLFNSLWMAHSEEDNTWKQVWRDEPVASGSSCRCRLMPLWLDYRVQTRIRANTRVRLVSLVHHHIPTQTFY